VSTSLIANAVLFQESSICDPVAAMMRNSKPYLNRKRISTAGPTLADVTNLPTIPPGGSQDGYMAM
jgi:hypothetical protein